ncbi:MAG: hypothetical protein V4653_09455 [Pseudomonadota bacterium]
MSGITVSAPTGGFAQEQVHGQDALFRADPAAFIRTNACMLQAEIVGDGTTARAFDTASCGSRGKEFIRTGQVRLTARLMIALRDIPGLPLIQAVEGTSAEGERVCFLPWKEDTCTLTKLSTAATLFLTGPLTGCNIYIAQKAGGHRPLVFHGNLNSDGEDRNTNNVRKDKEAINIASERGYVISHRLARGDYQIPAFVWATRAGDSWTFYVHEVNPVNRSFTNKPMPRL